MGQMDGQAGQGALLPIWRAGIASVDCMITQGHLRLVGFMLGCSCHGREIGSAVEPGLQQAGSDQRKVLANRGPVRLL